MTTEFLSHLQDALGPAYTIERELGGGGMSRVFLAREVALGREVVLKVLSPELTSSVNRDRFRREIQYAAQLQHPHIVPLLTAGESGDLLWYTMPRITGESLREVLDRRGALPVREALQILLDVVDALGSAHQRGLVHRDIKPENILVQGSHALVTDFGVAKAISAALPGSGATAVGVAVGTPAYMAPEQVAGDPAADHRIDLYALGLLAYELLTGETPFRGSSPHQTMAAHLIRQVTPPDTVRRDLPAGLSSIVMRCLQKDPDDRYPDAAALLSDLHQVDPAASGGHVAPAVATAGAPVGRGPRRGLRPLLPAAAVIGMILALVLLLMDRVTVVVGNPATDSAAARAGGAAAPTILTLADSIAIAEAVERRLAEQEEASAATRSMLDSIRREITRAVTDSVRRATPDARERWTVFPAPAAETRPAAGTFRAPQVPGVGPTTSFRMPADTGQSGVMVLYRDDARLAEVTAGGHLRVLDSLAAVFDNLPGVVRRAVPAADSNLRRGSLERAIESADSRFLVTIMPSRRRDSVSYTILVQDRESRTRPLRTIRTPYAALAQVGDVLTPEVAEQVRRTIAEMSRGPSGFPQRPRNDIP